MFQRATGKDVTAYVRDAGAIAYQCWRWERFGSITSFVRTLVEGSLRWTWTSARDMEASPDLGLPETRAWTLLSENSSADLIADLSETNVDGYGRFLILFGFTEGSERTIQTRAGLRDCLIRFAEGIRHTGKYARLNVVRLENAIEPIVKDAFDA